MEDLEIPLFFHRFDARKPVDQWVRDEVQEIVSEHFELRKSLEPRMSRRELVAFDKALVEKLGVEAVTQKLFQEAEEQRGVLLQSQSNIEQQKENLGNEAMQWQKEKNHQADVNAKTLNEDALFKQMAMTATQETKMRKDD